MNTIDEKFSAEQFEARGRDTPAANELAEELGKAVEMELHILLSEKMHSIAERLNAMGHDLKVEEFEPGSISFRDDWEDDEGYHCKMRLAVDTVISTGYPNLHDPDDVGNWDYKDIR